MDLPAIYWANIIIHARNPDNTQCLDNTFYTSYSLWFSQDGSKCNVFILFILQSSRFPKQEKSPPTITMLTRSLTNWKGSGKYNWSWDVVIYPWVWYSWRTWNVNRPARFCRVKRFKSFLVSLSMVTDGSFFLHAFPINSSSVFQRKSLRIKNLLFYVLSKHDGRRRKLQQL